MRRSSMNGAAACCRPWHGLNSGSVCFLLGKADHSQILRPGSVDALPGLYLDGNWIGRQLSLAFYRHHLGHPAFNQIADVIGPPRQRGAFFRQVRVFVINASNRCSHAIAVI